MGLHQDVLETGDGGVFVNTRDGLGVAITSTTIGPIQALDVRVANSISVGVVDETAFAYGVDTYLPVGGVYNSSITALSSGQGGVAALTPSRSIHSALYDAAGVAVGDTNPHGLFVRPGDGTNSQAYSATGEAFAQIRQGANAATVTAANELKVIDSSSAAILAFMKSATGTITSPTLTTSSSTLLASNANRKGFSFVNSSAFAVFVAHAATASAAAFTERVLPNSFYEHLNTHIYTGIVTMITPTVIGTPVIPVTEYT